MNVPPPAKRPARAVEGKVLKVHAPDRSLVEISIGSNSGLKLYDVLELFRLEPDSEYIGRLRILELRAESAMAGLTSPSRRDPREGDRVIADLNAAR